MIMKDIFDLYGFECKDIHKARTLVEGALNIIMDEHESSYRGEYFRFTFGSESFILQSNFDESDKEWFEEQFANYPIILYINYTNRSEQLKESLEQIDKCILLRHNTYDK